MDSYEILEEALESIADAGPDLRNGLTNHGPMAIEALAAMRRGDVIKRWLDGYRKNLLPRSPARDRIKAGEWRAAMADPDRFTDWRELFGEELEEASWAAVPRFSTNGWSGWLPGFLQPRRTALFVRDTRCVH